MEDIRLDEKQKWIVNLGPGKYSIRAGAGSGKTACLVEYTKQIIVNGAKPSDILLVTFTKKAAEEMSERLENPAVDCRTWHSYCLQILNTALWKHDRGLYPFQVVQGVKKKILLQKAMEKAGIDGKSADLATISLAIGRAKGLLADSTGDIEIDAVWKEYEKAKRRAKQIDFDDMITLAIPILQKDAEVRELFRKKWLLVDEAHDNSIAQHEVMKEIATDNLFLISSPDQCIYEWRTASPELIVNIKKRFPGIMEINLENNYRNGDGVIRTANKLIAHGKWRSLQMKNASGKQGDFNFIQHFGSLEDEAEFIASSICSDETAILYRTNWYAMQLEIALKQQGIPYHLLSGVSFFDFSEVADMIAYLKLSASDDHEAFLRVFNRPNRYLGNKWRLQAEDKLDSGISVQEVLSSRFLSSDRRELGYWWKNQQEFLAQLLALKCFENPGDLVSFIRVQIGYDDWLIKEKLEEDGDEEDLFGNLDEFELLARRCKTVEELLEQCKQNSHRNLLRPGVILGTIHRSKGLEWDKVHIAGLTEKLLPHFRSGNIEEERRLLYVGLTRGREVTASSAFHRQFQQPSAFLTELL